MTSDEAVKLAVVIARMQKELEELRKEFARFKRSHVAEYDTLCDRKGA